MKTRALSRIITCASLLYGANYSVCTALKHHYQHVADKHGIKMAELDRDIAKYPADTMCPGTHPGTQIRCSWTDKRDALMNKWLETQDKTFELEGKASEMRQSSIDPTSYFR